MPSTVLSAASPSAPASDVVRSPSYSTGVGLVMFGADQGKSIQLPSRMDDRPGMFKRAWSRLAEMF